MDDFKNLFDKETISSISGLVQNKMKILNQIPEFKREDKKFANQLEIFENSLSENLSDEFDNVMKLQFQLSDYYLTLAYYLGLQHGKQIDKL